MNGHDDVTAHEVATAAAVDATATDLIYGKYDEGQTYAALPPAPEGFEVRTVNQADGSTGFKYVAAGTPRERSGSNRFNGRGVYIRLHQNKVPGQKGAISTRMVLDAPIDHGAEVVVFNRNSVPTLVNSIQLGPRPITTQKGQNPYISGDNLLIACTIAARAQAIKVSAAAADMQGIEYTGKGFFKDDVNLEDVLTNPILIESALAYGSPGGDGFNNRLSYFSNDDANWGSDEAKSRVSTITAWMETKAAALGYDPMVIAGQIKAHIAMLNDAGLVIPTQLTALIS